MLEIGTHEAFVVFGALCATFVYLREADRHRELSEQTIWIALGALVAGAIGAKASTVWHYVAVAPEPSVVGALLYGGKSILGGLAGAYVGALVTKRLVGYRRPTGDFFAPAVALGMAIGRIGCFLTEQVGTPTSLPWGIAVDAETAKRLPMCPTCAPGVPMHPSFLYEIAFHVVMCGVLVALRRRVAVRGDLLKIYLLAYGVFRFAVEFVRGNPSVVFGLSYSQMFLIPTTLALAVFFVKRAALGLDRAPAFEPPV
jgi:prolipoprotein diacylglyceryl transferase